MRKYFNRLAGVGLGIIPFIALGAPATAADGPQRIKVSGEIIDTWCHLSGIMGVAIGTAHHQCAIWCAVGGVPVGLMGDDGKAYVLLKSDATGVNVANPTIIDIQTDHVTADADLYVRDGVNYLVVDKILANDGITNINHKELGILPFGE
jgi:hypothetical protein